MDKYEYKQKTEQMLELMEEGSHRKAAEIADTIDWKRVRNSAMLTSVSDIYEKCKDYQKSYQVLNLAYRRAEGSRKIVSKLCTLALKTGNVDEAIDYYDDFMQIAPKDPNQYILRYQILRAQRAPVEQQIEALEEYKKSEYIEEWAYELAKLYQEAGMTAECLEECDDLILWFSEGQYVYKAMELKMQYKPLTPSQQEKYDRRYEKLSGETEEMPDVVTYAESKADDEDEASADGEEQDVTADAAGTEGTEPESAAAEASEETAAGAGDSAGDTAIGTDTGKKKKIGNTMPLDEALRQLLHPESEEKEEAPAEPEEPEIGDLENAIDEIEAVVDVDMIKQLTEEREKAHAQKTAEASSAVGMTELTVEEDGEMDGQMSLDDIFNDWEGLPAEDAEEIPEEDEFPEEEFLAQDAAEDVPEDEPETPAAAQAETEDTAAPEEGELSEESPAEPEEDRTETGETEGVAMDRQETKKIEPILPPDIQRMIDEIEGVIPPEEEKKPAPVRVQKKEEPHENMGKVAESLRIDEEFEEDEFDEDGYADEEELTDDFDEPDDIDAEDGEEYFDEEEEFLDEEEDSDGEDEFFDDEEEFEEEEFLDEEEDSDGDEFFDDEEEFDEEESFDEEEDLDEDGFFDEEEDFDEDESFEEEEDFDEEDVDEEEYFGEDDESDGEYDDEYDEEEDYFGEDEVEDDAIDLDEEFRVNPEHADMPDDREVPDDDDDNMDILSATTPLSRKETAKMIATGKTAPLPLDEISDALSISDTGFVVHGRYDLAMQSGIGTRAGLTEEQKKLFSYFVPVRGMSEQLVDVLEQDKNCTNRQGTSRTGNLLIVGNKGNGKTVLAVDVVKAIQKQRNIRQGKVAIVTGDSLNKKKIGDIFDKLYGGALIIEKAGKMNEKTVARLNKAMERDTGELLIVLEEQRKPIDRLLSSNREFRRKFTSRLEVPIFINDELVTFGQTYAQENGYRIDEMGILALYSKIDSLQREDHAVTVAEVKEIMDDAISHSQKASAKKLVKRVFGKNTDEADRIYLSEKDFNM